jgi:RNA polymerase sigma-70 factor (ECF subfamily)
VRFEEDNPHQGSREPALARIDGSSGAALSLPHSCPSLIDVLSDFTAASGSPDRDGSSESDVVARLRQGETAAVGEAYDAHQAAVQAFARRLVGDAAAAQDLVHEVFVALPKAIHGFRGDARLRTFLLSMTVNHARHHLRAAARRRAAMDRFARDPSNDTRDPGQERHAMSRDFGRELSRALDALPLDQRVAFVLCEVEERTSRDAAEIVGVPEATVRTRVFHAKRKLREELEKRGVR